jgi:hypothetical protein
MPGHEFQRELPRFLIHVPLTPRSRIEDVSVVWATWFV